MFSSECFFTKLFEFLLPYVSQFLRTWFKILEKTEKHQENEVNDEEFNWNNVKRGNLKYGSNYMSVGNKFNHLVKLIQDESNNY
jgi:hypothetical protein